MSLYVILTPNGSSKPNRLGRAAMFRTLQAARDHCAVGERIVRWGNAGQCTGVWSRDDRGKVRKLSTNGRMGR